MGVTTMKRFLIATLVVFLAFTVLPKTAFAINNPDNLSITSIFGYQNILSDGDVLIVVRYDIDYTVLPTEQADEAFLVRFLSGVLELGSALPFPFNDDGYREGIVSFYFDPATVTANSITPAGSFTVRIQGNPTLFSTPPITDNGSILWRSSLATKFHLKNDLSAIAFDFEAAWSANDFDLIASTPEGNRLTIDGEEYFTNSILDLHLMIPDLFASGITLPTFEEREFTQSLDTNRAQFWAGTEIDVLFQAGADTLAISKELFSTILLLVGASFVAFMFFRVTQRVEAGMLVYALAIPVGAYVGFVPPTFAALVAAMAVLATGYVFFYKGSP